MTKLAQEIVKIASGININGRRFEIPVELDDYDEKASKKQKRLLDQILSNTNIDTFDKLKEYATSKNKNLDSKNVFKYISPKMVLVPKLKAKKGEGFVLFDSSLEPEHGLALKFKNGVPDKFVVQDEAL